MWLRRTARTAALVVAIAPLAEGRARAQDAGQAPPAEPAAAPAEPAAPPAGPEPATQPAAPVEPEPEPEAPPTSFVLPSIDVHGFVSQGALVSTHNDYLGHSKRGSVELTEAAVNFSTEPADRLRVGAQLFTRDIGPVGDYKMTLDWAFLDYRFRPYLGFRAGRVKLPFGLYNEYSDIDSARLPILLPQSLYPTLSRDLLLAHTGFSVYGALDLGGAGGVDYQAYYGSWFVDKSLYNPRGGHLSIDSIDTRRVLGGQLFWRPPVDNLRLGGSLLFTQIDFHVRVDDTTAAQLVAAGAAPPGFDGTYVASFDPVALWVGSLEYGWGDLQLSAEYSRWYQTITSSLPAVTAPSKSTSERAYAMLSYRFTDALEGGAYFSSQIADVDDRRGEKLASYPERAWQRDYAASLRYDVNDAWLVKAESHFMDGAAYLTAADNPDPKRYWWLFLVKTTVFF